MAKKRRSTVQRRPQRRMALPPDGAYEFHGTLTQRTGSALIMWLSTTHQIAMLDTDSGVFQTRPNGELVFMWHTAHGDVELPLTAMPDPTQHRVGAIIMDKTMAELCIGCGVTAEDAYSDFCEQLIALCTNRFGVMTTYKAALGLLTGGGEPGDQR